MTKTVQAGNVQAASKRWWETNPMSYDWHRTLQAAEGTPEFFEEIDRRFFGSCPAYSGKKPFDRFIPFERLEGRRVLEIGCGLGAHAQLLAEAGCELHAIDLTRRAVEMTGRRLALRGLQGQIRNADAEHTDFPGEYFDFIWSWGVIHHSSNTEQIIREVHRILKPGGEFRFMVYHRRSLLAATSLVRGFVSGKFFRGMSVEEVLSHYTDGFLARYYSEAELAALLRRNGFCEVQTSITGQKSELIPLPGRGAVGDWKYGVLRRLPDSAADRMLAVIGSFLFAVAVKGGAVSAGSQ